MHQSTTPSLSQTIWPKWASRQFFTLLIVQTLLPMTFAYSLSLEAVVMRQLRRWKRLWRRSFTHWHLRTSMGPSRSCWKDTSASRRRLLRRGLEFHVCTINKNAHTKKVWNLIVWTSYIYIYIYILLLANKKTQLLDNISYFWSWKNQLSINLKEKLVYLIINLIGLVLFLCLMAYQPL